MVVAPPTAGSGYFIPVPATMLLFTSPHASAARMGEIRLPLP